LATVEYNDVFEHRADFEGLSSSATNISVDPRFAETRSYKLKPDSPCIGTGESGTEGNDSAGSRSDMGAHGGPGTWDAKESYWYPRLLTHSDVDDALTSDLCPEAAALVMKEVQNLERGCTDHWQDLDDPGVSCLTRQDVETVWARRVALNLFHEVNGRLPWSILDYDQKALSMLLRLDESCFWSDLPSMDVKGMLSTDSSHENSSGCHGPQTTSSCGGGARTPLRSGCPCQRCLPRRPPKPRLTPSPPSSNSCATLGGGTPNWMIQPCWNSPITSRPLGLRCGT
jgi:hypothetical protein